MRSLLLLFIAAFCAAEQADVVVYGATPGGFCAAIAAAREGSKVILVEPTGHVGGLSTGGLSHCDSNQMRRESLTGLFEEWHVRIAKDYVARGQKAPYDPMDKTPGIRWVFEPHVAMRVTLSMLREAGVTVITEAPLIKVEKSGARISRLRTTKGDFTARTFVDGTYEGDLMAAAGVEWVIGREGRAEHGESLAGKQYPKPAMRISGFGDDGRPLPLVTDIAEGDPEAGDRNVMTYSFRLCLTRNPADRVPVPEPDHYDPAKFELARRALKAGVRGIGFDLYPLPGDKLDGNNSIGGQISIGIVGGSNTWHEADGAGRARIWEAHRQYTLEFLRFLRTDPSVPEKTRAEYASLGLCKDEFAATGHFPPKSQHTIRYYGLYSNKSRGMTSPAAQPIVPPPEKRESPAENEKKAPPPEPDLLLIPSPPASAQAMKPLWRDLILATWGADPLQCPCCKGTMKRVETLIQPEKIEFFLRLLGMWEGLINIPPPPDPPFDIETFEPIEPPWQAIKQWIPADDDEPSFHWQDTHHSNESQWKPREVPLDDDRILVLDVD